MTYVAHYVCTRCKHAFSQRQPENPPPTCPNCQCLWVKWVNYDELKEKFGWS